MQNKKVYVVCESWASNGDSGASVLGVYSTVELALQGLRKAIADFRNNTGEYDTVNYGSKDSFTYESYDEGFWSETHEWLFIEPMVIDEKVAKNELYSVAAKSNKEEE